MSTKPRIRSIRAKYELIRHPVELFSTSVRSLHAGLDPCR